MSEKSVSQKIAKVFEIAGYFSLIGAAVGLAISFGLIISGQASVFVPLIWAVIAAGITLFVGYCKHSRGTLSEAKTRALWIGTIAYNSLFLLPSLFNLFLSLKETNSQNNLLEIVFSGYGWLLTWWTIAIGGSIIALGNYKSVQKYR